MEENKKYKLTDETIDIEGKTLYRIEALKDFNGVRKVDKVGYVESEKNLSQKGNCWIYDDACAFDDAIVKDNALLFNESRVHSNANIEKNARIYGYSMVLDNACVSDNAHLYDNSVVFGNARVYDNAHIHKSASIFNDAKVYGHACVTDRAVVFETADIYGYGYVCDNAQVYGNANVFEFATIGEYAKVFGTAYALGNARIRGNACVRGDARVTGDAIVYDDAIIEDYCVVHGNACIGGNVTLKKREDYVTFYEWWSIYNITITWTRPNNMLRVGTFYGTAEELVKQAYEDDEKFGRQYEHFMKSIEAIIKEEDGEWMECQENTGHWAWSHPRENGSVQLVPLQGDVRFHDVTFGYNEKKTVLHNISLFAKPGQKIAFVGATGAGKTTITNLINRFYDIQKGSITYDGIDVKLIKKDDLRRSLGIVLQDVNLFSGTIMDNIRYGNLNASDEECIQAAKLANAHDFIKHLEHGYYTEIKAGQETLSQGQKQLISIARAAVANPPVLILDEATSSIDTRTEKIVQEGMDKLMEGRTVFVIAHRLSTIQNSNAIMVLENGHIIERGNHEDLLNQKGMYYHLYTGSFEENE